MDSSENRHMKECRVILERIPVCWKQGESGDPSDSDLLSKFTESLNSILESVEDLDLTEKGENNVEEEEEEEEETDRRGVDVDEKLLQNLSSVLLKLKSKKITNKVSESEMMSRKLSRFVILLNRLVRSGCREIIKSHDDDDDQDGVGWTEEDAEIERRLVVLCEACTTSHSAHIALLLLTSHDMPKFFYLEDLIRSVVSFVKTQISNVALFRDHRLSSCFEAARRVSKRYSQDSAVSLLKLSSQSQLLYAAVSSLIGLLAELINIQQLTDTTILQISTLSLSTFVVENVVEMQVKALELIGTIFQHYEKHRGLIRDDVLSCFSRLPTSSKSHSTFLLECGIEIRMMTALILRLLQSLVPLSNKSQNGSAVDTGVEKVAAGFLSAFLAKCWTTRGEDNEEVKRYRTAMENFIKDLLTILDHPEWPAAFTALGILGELLVLKWTLVLMLCVQLRLINSKQAESTNRCVGLELYGGIAVQLNMRHERRSNELSIINSLLLSLTGGVSVSGMMRLQTLREVILRYLSWRVTVTGDNRYELLRQYYMEQWRRDDVEFGAQFLLLNDMAHQNSVDIISAEELPHPDSVTIERYKLGDLTQVEVCSVIHEILTISPTTCTAQHYLSQILQILCETTIAIRTKAIKCLSGIISANPSILTQNEVKHAVHSRLVDSSASVREAVVDLLGRFMSHQSSVMWNEVNKEDEETVWTHLMDKYYTMIIERITDVSVNVRKRIIKILQDICSMHPTYHNIPLICIAIISRVADEETVKKLVNDTFVRMWFTPVPRGHDPTLISHRASNICSVIRTASPAAVDYLQQLVENVLRPVDKEGRAVDTRLTELSCQQIVDSLVHSISSLQAGNVEVQPVSLFRALHMFCKAKPLLLKKHCTVIRSALDANFVRELDSRGSIRFSVVLILQLCIPLCNDLSHQFLADLEESLCQLLVTEELKIVESCVTCLAQLVKNRTHNYTLIHSAFWQFFGLLVRVNSMLSLMEGMPNGKPPTLPPTPPFLLRSLFVVGLFTKEFDFDSAQLSFQLPQGVTLMTELIFSCLLYFTRHKTAQIKLRALHSIGCFTVGRSTYLMSSPLKDLYIDILSGSCSDAVLMRAEVLRNIRTFLISEELSMMAADARWKVLREEVSLKEMTDVQTGICSAVIQIYLKLILECYFSRDKTLRFSVLDVVTVVLHQGLVHPGQCVPHLIAMCSDVELMIRSRADSWLAEIHKKYHGFVQSMSMRGLRLSYRLHSVLVGEREGEGEVARGVQEESLSAVCTSLYTLMRHNKGQRRVLLSSLLKLFHESANLSLEEQMFVADNLAHFSYKQQDEPLYVIHSLEATISVTGSDHLQTFTETFYPHRKFRKRKRQKLTNVEGVEENGRSTREDDDDEADDDDDEDVDEKETLQSLMAVCPHDLTTITETYKACHSSLLLFLLKKHLKTVYGLSETLIQKYSPLDKMKTFEKNMSRKHDVLFNPSDVLTLINHHTEHVPPNQICRFYMMFKQLMMSLDPAEDDDDDVNDDEGDNMTDRVSPCKRSASQQQINDENESLDASTSFHHLNNTTMTDDADDDGVDLIPKPAKRARKTVRRKSCSSTSSR